MKPVVLAVPTLIRYDLLRRLIRTAEEGTRKPDRYLVIDNGGTLDEASLGLGDRLTLHRPGRNLGVAASWNYALKAEPDAHVVVAGDDVMIGRWTIERMVRHLERANGLAHVRALGFGLFLQGPKVAERIGYYDEAFWPAYWEDSDYERRLMLGNIPRIKVQELRPQEGGGSMTIRSATGDLKREIQKGENRNSHYYYRKWGGPRGAETFRTPFGKPTQG